MMSDDPQTDLDRWNRHRTEAGHWPKGVSGNPGGYSIEKRKAVAKVAELAREHTPAAIQTLATIMLDEKASRVSRIAAANALLDRAYGKPPQSVGIDLGLDDDAFERMSSYETARRIAFVLQRAVQAPIEAPAASAIAPEPTNGNEK